MSQQPPAASAPAASVPPHQFSDVVDEAILASPTTTGAQAWRAAARLAKRHTTLYYAAFNGDVAMLTKQISRGTDLSWRHPQGGATALYVSCENGHLEAVKLLLATGAAADQARDDGSTPLFVSVSMACERALDGGKAERLQVVEALLAAGAAPDLPVRGLTPLWIACHHNAPALVRALLDGRASPTAAVQGWTPLQLAESAQPGGAGGAAEEVRGLLRASAAARASATRRVRRRRGGAAAVAAALLAVLFPVIGVLRGAQGEAASGGGGARLVMGPVSLGHGGPAGLQCRGQRPICLPDGLGLAYVPKNAGRLA